MKIIVFAEREKAYAELCRGAGQLAGAVEAVRVGLPDQLGEDTKSLADKIWLIPAQDGAMLEDYTETIAALLNRENPDLLLVEPTKRGKTDRRPAGGPSGDQRADRSDGPLR